MLDCKRNLTFFSILYYRNEDGSLVFVKKSDQKVTVSIPKLSLSVTTDGKTTEIMVSCEQCDIINLSTVKPVLSKQLREGQKVVA